MVEMSISAYGVVCFHSIEANSKPIPYHHHLVPIPSLSPTSLVLTIVLHRITSTALLDLPRLFDSSSSIPFNQYNFLLLQPQLDGRVVLILSPTQPRTIPTPRTRTWIAVLNVLCMSSNLAAMVSMMRTCSLHPLNHLASRILQPSLNDSWALLVQATVSP